MPNFRASLTDPDEFTLTFELVPGRGSRSARHDRIKGLVTDLARDGRICALSVTDNAGGHAMLAPEVVGQEIMAAGLDVISHFSCKDKNRNKMESLLLGLNRTGLSNLLVISGDYPGKGYCGGPKPVFDLDSVQALAMIKQLNQGRGGPEEGTDFFMGVAVSPFKTLEAEQRLQYRKLSAKAGAGAHYGITQLGFDARKYQEALLYVETRGLNLPLLANVFIPNLTVARLMRAGQIPGCLMPESLWQLMVKEAQGADQGRQARLLRGARQLAILQGLGYSGAHIGGPGLAMTDLDFLLTKAAQLRPNWQEQLDHLNHWPANTFYFFGQEGELNSHEEKAKGTEKKFSPVYRANSCFHELFFSPRGPLYNLSRQTCSFLEKSGLSKPFGALEHLGKFLLFACRNCGDCTLSHFAYHCPQSGCAKYLLNGPCGGSQNGWCEVHPGKKKCHYVKAYNRLQGVGREESLGREFVPPRNWQLNNSSSWLNYFAGRDNSQSRPCQGSAPPKG
ncbi:MAG: methylenetetrahydrofolate reductase C-terminal domain-containing protein [Thermodesulfobacteriota bacterium]